MLDKIMKWRKDFELKTTRSAAINMLKEEFLELMVEYDQQIEGEEVTPEFRKEWADLVFVVVQAADAFGVDMESTIWAVLESNYSKRMTIDEFNRAFPDDCPHFVKFRDGYAYLYDEQGKLLKSPNYKKAEL